ncbi:MAG: alpha/beta hydrolase [Bacteroidetes bacterium]|nr:alpha/beta hydrolase [Bacteroidota bacterium]
MSVIEQINLFSSRYGKSISINNTTWRYYILGTGEPILWLTGGMRRAALGFAFMEKLAKNHVVIAPDYPPVHSIDDFFAGLDAILRTEKITSFVLGGQSYGGILAQAYLARNVHAVEKLILSSSGPVNAIGKAWSPMLNIVTAVMRILPEKMLKEKFSKELNKHINVQESERAEWLEIIRKIIQNDLTRSDVLSHFTVAVDILKKGIVTSAAYKNWTGRVIVLSAENDPTQRKSDLPRYEQLFNRPVKVLNLGKLGHTAALFDPDKYVDLLERELGLTILK